MYRKSLSKRKSKKLFRRTAKKVHRKNRPSRNMRGGRRM